MLSVDYIFVECGEGGKEEGINNIIVKDGDWDQMIKSLVCQEEAVQFDPGQDRKPLKDLSQNSVIARYLFLKMILGKLWKIYPGK